MNHLRPYKSVIVNGSNAPQGLSRLWVFKQTLDKIRFVPGSRKVSLLEQLLQLGHLKRL